MGNIKKVLALEEIDPRVLTANLIWTDLCENVHLHYRNTRFDFSELEFAHFRAAINQCGMAVEQIAEDKDYKEGNPNFLIQQIFNVQLKTDSTYYPNRVSIELNKDNTIHFHYRDVRLHFTLTEFKMIASMFSIANMRLKNLVPFKYKGTTNRIRTWVDIKSVQPYDEGHRPGVFDNEHREGIEYVKKLIKRKRLIRPILVNTDGQRLDGFKRYMAALELGHVYIECFIDPWAKMGGQHNHKFLDDKGEENDIKT